MGLWQRQTVGCGLKRKKNTDNKKTMRRKKSTKEKNTIDKLLPKRALTDLDISRFATNVFDLSNSRGVFMLDTLPIDSGPLYRENAIVNFNRSTEPGSHWVAYKKKGRYVSYFPTSRARHISSWTK